MTTYKPTQRIIPVDLDGNHLAKFIGSDAPQPADIFAAFPEAVKLMVYRRDGEIAKVIHPAA